MGSLVLGIIIFIFGLVLAVAPLPSEIKVIKRLISGVAMVAAFVIAGFGGMSYNTAGHCQHIQTIMGTESSTCKTGWYFLGWGTSTQWPHFITVAHTNDQTAAGSSISGTYPVRLADNWNGDVTQTTRFGIPQDREQFMKMHRDFRSPERLISTTLRPAVTASLDSVANLFTMEEYYAGGQRDAFKTEFRDAVVKGRAKVRQVTTFTARGVIQGGQSPSDLESAQDSSNVGETNVRRTKMEKVLVDGNEVRESHGYMNYGITVSSAILENLDPDDKFEQQIQARKDAASRRIVAQEERREQEEQRLLAIQSGETEIAKRQAAARVEQIEKTTNAETAKKLALIDANLKKEQAEVDRQTSEIRLQQARIDAETQQTLADAEAYERSVILEADNALQAKLDAWVEVNGQWADAAANINVPTTVFTSGGGSEGTTGNMNSVEQFMNLMTMSAAQQLDVNPRVAK
jgi:hypothetical protein